MTNYYVDATLGSDANTGSIDFPWQTISKVNGESLNPGDQVLLRCGEQWRERFRNDSLSGAQSSPIVIGQYGSGVDPIINGSDLATTWVDEGGNVWSSVEFALDPYSVRFDGVHGLYAYSLVGVTAEYDWYYDDATNKLYVHATGDPSVIYTNPGVEVAVRRCMTTFNWSYVTVQNIHFIGGYLAHIGVWNGGNNIIIENCVLTSSYWGIWNNDIDGPVISDVTIRNNTLRDISKDGIFFAYHTQNWTVENNDLRDGGMERGRAGDGSNAIKVNRETATGHVIQNNTIVGWRNVDDLAGAHGIHIDYGCTNCIVRYNHCEDCGVQSSWPGNGVSIEACSDNQCYYNEIVDCGRGINLITRDTAPPTERNEIYNNTIHGCNQGIRVLQGASPLANGLMDNIIRNNIVSAVTTQALSCFRGGDNDGINGNGNIYTHNCFGPEATNFIEWGQGIGYHTYDAWEAVYGSSTNSVELDPLLLDVANDDFNLSSSSPCIEAGIDVNLAQDYRGVAVPQGVSPDVGAFEYRGHRIQGIEQDDEGRGESGIVSPVSIRSGVDARHY